jgi:hypothetical protein
MDMPLTVKQRFTLIDAVTLIAATAIGLALLRPALSPLKARNMSFAGRWPWLESGIFHGLLYATPVLFAWSVASFALSLRQRRCLFRSISRSPGFVMNAAAIAGVLCISMHYVGQTVIDPSRADTTYMHVVSTGLPGDVGYFVVGSLVALALFRRLRPRPIWTDRLCWTLSWVWVGMAILTWWRLYLVLLR